MLRTDEALWDFLMAVADEWSHATTKHPLPLHSAHEAYAVILEEVDEFKAQVYRQTGARSSAEMVTELAQIAAMCARTAIDLSLTGALS